MPRGDQVTRILKVIQLLETHPQGLTVREIHNQLQDARYSCTTRTVYRDLTAVQEAYFPITTTGTGDESRWKLESIASLNKKIQFSYDELIALFLARESLSILKGSSLYQHIESFFFRIEQALGPRVTQELQLFKNYIGFKPVASWQTGVSQEVLDTIHDACAEGHVLEISYRSVSGPNKGQITARRVGPEGLYFADSGVYLIAKDLAAGIHKTYSLSRVANAVKTDEPYDSELSDLKQYLQEGIGVLRSGATEEIEIRVDEPIASYVGERRWHESQNVTRTQNGIVLKMKLRVNDELARWILGLGPAARVISPQSLADHVYSLAHATAEKYSKKVA